MNRIVNLVIYNLNFYSKMAKDKFERSCLTQPSISWHSIQTTCQLPSQEIHFTYSG